MYDCAFSLLLIFKHNILWQEKGCSIICMVQGSEITYGKCLYLVLQVGGDWCGKGWRQGGGGSHVTMAIHHLVCNLLVQNPVSSLQQSGDSSFGARTSGWSLKVGRCLIAGLVPDFFSVLCKGFVWPQIASHFFSPLLSQQWLVVSNLLWLYKCLSQVQILLFFELLYFIDCKKTTCINNRNNYFFFFYHPNLLSV